MDHTSWQPVPEISPCQAMNFNGKCGLCLYGYMTILLSGHFIGINCQNSVQLYVAAICYYVHYLHHVNIL
jgi:hypothetical protein